ncbi:chromosome segregation ATPase [Methanococcus maripaludis]|uniref:Chromosome segregation ATPase n=1 Tax=Methanococcus maripaludis TaxID=39152 RepID=A0A7J9NXU4_METMI|nr:hypothetical protein [Methanococcus maripaludis]MBA2851843.1 chromosome segregation ATPase [Methanococcus maripaludis]
MFGSRTRKENADLKQQLDAMAEQLKAATEQLSEANTKLETYESNPEISNLHQKIHDLEIKLEEANLKPSAVEREYRRKMEELDSTYKHAETLHVLEKEALQKNIDALTKIIEGKEAECEQRIKAALTTCEAKIKDNEEMYNAQKEKIKEMAKLEAASEINTYLIKHNEELTSLSKDVIEKICNIKPTSVNVVTGSSTC